MELSILIPTISGRFDRVGRLIESLERRAKGLPVEILWLGDNRQRTLSKKREALVQIAKGKYITHLDDDDDLAADFFPRVLDAIFKVSPGVVSYNSQATINGQNPFVVRSSVEYENEHARYEGPDGAKLWYDIKRKPWHWCTWRADIARHIMPYPDLTYGEDWAIVQPMLKHIDELHRLGLLDLREVKLDTVMHYYIHNDKETTCDGST